MDMDARIGEHLVHLLRTRASRRPLWITTKNISLMICSSGDRTVFAQNTELSYCHSGSSPSRKSDRPYHEGLGSYVESNSVVSRGCFRWSRVAAKTCKWFRIFNWLATGSFGPWGLFMDIKIIQSDHSSSGFWMFFQLERHDNTWWEDSAVSSLQSQPQNFYRNQVP